MDWFSKDTKANSEQEAEVVALKEEEVKPSPKTEDQCVMDGCYNPKAPAQTYLCVKHMRSN